MDDSETRSAPGTLGTGNSQPHAPDSLLRVRQIKSQMARVHERSQLVLSKLIGADEETARRIISEAACELRVARRDQERFVRDMSYQPSRITVEIEGGQVISAIVG